MILRAVLYCRCSTEEESQRDALVKQVAEAEECIRKNGWLLADSYVESKSGTTTKGRTEYNRLFEELSQDRFDIVVAKSQDRLMRNAKDWYLFLDRLVSFGKKLYLYIENKFYTPDDALVTGIKAILAEEYSLELSKKMNNAHRNRQKRGQVFLLPPNTYGLRKTSEGRYELVEEEAEAIQTMFRLTKEHGCGAIANILEANRMYDRQGRPFEAEAIRRIIRNPIRCGTVIQNQRHWDFRAKRMIQTPEEEWIIHKKAVPACVSEEEWLEANRAMDKRAGARTGKNGRPKDGHTGENTGKSCQPIDGRAGKYDLSGKLRCGRCGAVYYRSHRKRYKDGSSVIEWKCSSYLYHGKRGAGCDNILLNEEKIFDLLNDVCGQYCRTGQTDLQNMIDKTLLILERVLTKSDTVQRKQKLEERLKRDKEMSDKLLDKLLRDVITDADYLSKRKELEDSVKETEEELEKLKTVEEGRPAVESRMQAIRSRLESSLVMKAMVSEMIGCIETIIVFPEHLEVHFCPELPASINGKSEKQKTAIVFCPLPEDFIYQRKKAAERERIVRYIKENPHITAKEIARFEKISLSAANYRINKLKTQGRIRFEGRGGHGKWVVI